MLRKKFKFSFETVFSHPGKVAIMKEAQAAGYKVYLYFISTEDPSINVHRVKNVRVRHKGHDVPEAKIRSRYKRSLNLMFEASQYAYQAFFLDNSEDTYRLIAHFKVVDGIRKWDHIDQYEIPFWFTRYFSNKESASKKVRS